MCKYLNKVVNEGRSLTAATPHQCSMKDKTFCVLVSGDNLAVMFILDHISLFAEKGDLSNVTACPLTGYPLSIQGSSSGCKELSKSPLSSIAND